ITAMLAVARRRSGAKSQIPSGSAMTNANKIATTSGKSRRPSRCPAPKISAVNTATSSRRARVYASTSIMRLDRGSRSDTARAYPRRVYSDQGGFCVAFLLLILVLAGLIYVGWRLTRMTAGRPKTRVIGPDDDPDFLRRLGHGDNNPR